MGNFDPTGGCDPYFKVLRSTGGSFKDCKKLYNSKDMEKLRHYKKEPYIDLVPKGGALPIAGDIYIEVLDHDVGFSKDDKMCAVWFNTAFVDPAAGPLSFAKPQIDKACKNKKNFDPSFSM